MISPDVLSPLQASKARSVLRNLRGTHDGIEGCALMTADGHVAASALSEGADTERFGAICAALIALASRATREAQRGELQQLILEGESGPMLLTRAGARGVLAVAASPACPLGRMILDSKAAAVALADVIGGDE